MLHQLLENIQLRRREFRCFQETLPQWEWKVMLRRLVPHMQLSEETQCRGGRSSSISCFTCRATAFYSAFPEAPHHQAVISVLTIPYYSKIGGEGVSVLCQQGVSPEPFGSGAGAPEGSAGAGTWPRTASTAQSQRCHPLLKQNPTPGQSQDSCSSHTPAHHLGAHTGAQK